MRAPRTSVSMFIGRGDSESFGLTVNVSRSGMLLKTDEPPPVGTTHAINLVWGGDTFECEVRVARHAEGTVGVAFVDPQPGFVAVVDELIDNND